ncbi:hypothetical protein C3K47_10250 [Solitalea longa]|uniref:Uncharacterized protein n=1 Tax=Solitalea longa TaxID=2079460 RepID=A0A2S5A2C9_9SPHI|nr:hypothetical protein [Solitalea longa]POY36731.1 hypothetical protein C3K47_10250 [Solitalea longa]
MKSQLTNYILKREAGKIITQLEFNGLKEVESFLFIFCAENIEDLKEVKDLALTPDLRQKKLTFWGLINEKDLPEFRTEARDFNFITNKDLNYLKIPKEDKVKELQKVQFDVLINLSQEINSTISYLALKANSRFKISKYEQNQSFIYDLMIDCKKDTSIVNFTAQVLHYLSLIKK